MRFPAGRAGARFTRPARQIHQSSRLCRLGLARQRLPICPEHYAALPEYGTLTFNHPLPTATCHNQGYAGVTPTVLDLTCFSRCACRVSSVPSLMLTD